MTVLQFPFGGIPWQPTVKPFGERDGRIGLRQEALADPQTGVRLQPGCDWQVVSVPARRFVIQWDPGMARTTGHDVD